MGEQQDGAAEVEHQDGKQGGEAVKQPGAEASQELGTHSRESAFDRAFRQAESKLKGEEPAEAKKAKPKAKDDGDDEKPAPKKKAPTDADAKAKAEEKPAPKKAAKAEKEGDDDDGDPDGSPSAPKKPLEPRRSWSNRRKEDFRYLTPEEQQAWIDEPLAPETSWDESTKAAFAKMPVEAQEELIVKSRSLEHGYHKKFEALAAERKQWEDIKAAIPPRVKALMEQRGASEAVAFRTLVQLQDFAMRDPVGYVADFIKRGKVDVNAIAEKLGDAGQAPAAQHQADIRSHPEFRALADQVGQLKGMLSQFQQQAQSQAAEADKQAATALETALTARDDRGALRYPLARVLGNYMADLIEHDPETYGGMEPAARFDLAYRTAVSHHPELRSVQTAKKAAPTDDEPSDADDEDADAGQTDRRAKLKAAQTRKSNAPHSAPARSGDPLRAAFEKAQKTLRR